MNKTQVINEVSKAISAHGMWKQTLRSAIDTGECSSTPEKVRQDCNCSLGKWLLTRIDPELHKQEIYKEIVEIHAKFHIEASQILTLALSRKIDEANKRIKLGSEFSQLSSQLISKLSQWQKEL